MMLIFILASFLLTKVVSQADNECLQISEYASGNIPQPLVQIESSSITLEKGATSQPQNLYNITLRNTTATSGYYQIGIGLSYIQNYFDPCKLDFSTKSIMFPTYFTINFTINPNASWSSVHIHYVATSRNDIRANNLFYQNSQIWKSSNPNITSNNSYITYNFGNKRNAVSPYTFAFGFLSGLSCNDRFIDVRIQYIKINMTTNTLNFSMTINSQSIVDNLCISYVMYTTDNINPIAVDVIANVFTSQRQSFVVHMENQFIGVFGLNARNLPLFFATNTTPPTTTNTITNNINNNNTKILQISSISPQITASNSNTNIATIGFAQTVQSAPKLQQINLQLWVSSFNIKGLSINYKVNYYIPVNNRDTESMDSVDTTVSANFSLCVNYTSCIKMDGNYVDIDGQYICVICKPYSSFDSTINKCVCNNGYVRDAARNCVPINNTNNTNTNNTNTTNNTNSTNNNTNSTGRSGANTTIDINITNNNTNNNISCNANFTYDAITKTCICKPPLFSYTSQTNVKKCITACTTNLTFDLLTQKCVCQSNQYNNNICINCQDDLAQWNKRTKKCQCKFNSMRINGGNCKSCSQFADFDSFMKICVCWDGYQGNGVTCSPITL